MDSWQEKDEPRCQTERCLARAERGRRSRGSRRFRRDARQMDSAPTSARVRRPRERHTNAMDSPCIFLVGCAQIKDHILLGTDWPKLRHDSRVAEPPLRELTGEAYEGYVRGNARLIIERVSPNHRKVAPAATNRTDRGRPG